MNKGSWKKGRHMNLVNRGLETIVVMKYLPATETYRVSKIERMIGGQPATTYDRILDTVEATESFVTLCTEALSADFEHPSLVDGKVIDLTSADQS